MPWNRGGPRWGGYHPYYHYPCYGGYPYGGYPCYGGLPGPGRLGSLVLVAARRKKARLTAGFFSLTGDSRWPHRRYLTIISSAERRAMPGWMLAGASLKIRHEGTHKRLQE
jgi:hypothetical protein